MWKCDNCIHKDGLNDKISICNRRCKDAFARLNKINYSYQEKISKPMCCNECIYLKRLTDYCVCAVCEWDKDAYEVKNKVIRKNYLTKNTPKWCKLI